jgi:RND family efflux transporter MFP subunit
VESPLQAWLTLQCQTITGTEAALAVLGASEHAPGSSVAHWPSRDEVSPRLSATVEAALERGKVAVQEPAAATQGAPATTHLALPVVRAGRVAGAVGVSVRGVSPAEVKAIADLLGRGVGALELLIEAEGDRERLAGLLSLAGCLLDHEHLAQASHALAVELAQRIGCERVAVGLLRDDRMRVLALSNNLHFTEESEAVRELCGAMEEAADLDEVVELPAASGTPPRVAGAHDLLLRSSGAGAVCTVPLVARGHGIGALTCEWSGANAVGATARSRVRDTALLCGPILELMGRAEAPPLERARAWLAGWIERHFGADRSLAKGVAVAAAVLVLVLIVAPASYRISARASLEGRVQRALVAAVTGYIAEANARAGDLVLAGDVLARLDDRDLRLEHSKWASQRTQLEKEYREALAGQDRTQVSILSAQIEQASAQLGLAAEQLGRTSVIAPFDGVVLEGDLDGLLGSPVEQGTVLFEVAPLDGYRIIVEVDERDIADVAVGQRGRLALSALPGQPLPLVVERITPIATSEDGRNYFRVEAVLEEPSETLRPGMEGIAKIDAGKRRLLWIWTHEMFDWLRLSTWSWMP